MKNSETSSAHTKGPWNIRVVNMAKAVVSESGMVIAASLYDEAHDPSIEEIDANACLIAAAPDLLGACSRTRNILRLVREGHLRVEVVDEEIEILQRIIDMAKGTSA